MSLTVGEFERLAQVKVWRDQQPDVPFSAKTPKTWSTQNATEPMTAFRGADSVQDLAGQPIAPHVAIERFKAAAGNLPEWAVGAKAALGSDITFVITG
jgi:hypothetical protein